MGGSKKSVGGLLLAVRVLDIEPQHVVGNIVDVEVGVHLFYVVHIVVVPPTLVVSQSEVL